MNQVQSSLLLMVTNTGRDVSFHMSCQTSVILAGDADCVLTDAVEQKLQTEERRNMFGVVYRLCLYLMTDCEFC